MGRILLFFVVLALSQLCSCGQKSTDERFYYLLIDSSEVRNYSTYLEVMQTIRETEHIKLSTQLIRGEITREAHDMKLIEYDNAWSIWNIEQEARFEFFKNGMSLKEIDSTIEASRKTLNP